MNQVIPYLIAIFWVVMLGTYGFIIYVNVKTHRLKRKLMESDLYLNYEREKDRNLKVLQTLDHVELENRVLRTEIDKLQELLRDEIPL